MIVSVVIPNYNGNKYLRQCLEYLRTEISRIEDYTLYKIEVIVIDNASVDDNYQWVKTEYSEYLFERLDKNYGFSKAVNEGIKLATGKYVILLNNDTEIEEGFLKALVSVIESDDNVFAICSQMIQYQNPNLVDDAGDGYNLLGWAYKRGDGELVGAYNKQEEVFSACAGAAIYRKTVFEEIGYFDEQFFAYMEDVDISYRARVYGYKNLYCPEAKVLHIGSATSGSRYNEFKVRLAARNNIYVPYKNMPLVQLMINSPFLIVGYIVKYIFFKRKGFGQAYLDGFTEGLKTARSLDKVPFKWKHVGNYMKIEGQLINNTVTYIWDKLKNRYRR